MKPVRGRPKGTGLLTVAIVSSRNSALRTELTGFTKPGAPDVVRAVLVYRFSGELIREISILGT